MRLIFFIFLGALLLFLGYAYQHNPEGCAKVGADVVAVCRSLLPGGVVPASTSAPVAELATNAVMTTPEPTPATNPPPAAPSLPPVVFKPWTPPEVIPAQPNWTWTTIDGTTYQNVVVTKIEQDTVSITHSSGVAHVPISMLPADIQKQLNYDPQAAAVAKEESDREAAHPYYTLATLADAQKIARQLHWPLAWMCADLASLKVANPPTNSDDELTQMALNHLKSQAIVIYVDGNRELSAMPPFIVEGQFFQMDDGPLPGGHHFYGPKIAFSDAEITKAYGRVSHTQLVASREAALDAALDAALQAITAGTPVPVPVPPGAKAP